MVALPAARLVTTPLASTVATDALLVLQLTDLSVALEGETVSVNVLVPPLLGMDTDVGDTVTPVTSTVSIADSLISKSSQSICSPASPFQKNILATVFVAPAVKVTLSFT